MAEWTLGALNLVRFLMKSYDDEATLAALRADEKSMELHLLALRSDLDTASLPDAVPQNYDALISLPEDELALLYANTRYFIPFGWNANPLPSTCSTGWAVMMALDYNPFVLGGKQQTL